MDGIRLLIVCAALVGQTGRPLEQVKGFESPPSLIPAGATVDPAYRPKVGDTSIMASFLLGDREGEPCPVVACHSIADLRRMRALLSDLGRPPGDSELAGVRRSVLAAGTEVVVVALIGADAKVRIAGGAHRGAECFVEVGDLARLIRPPGGGMSARRKAELDATTRRKSEVKAKLKVRNRAAFERTDAVRREMESAIRTSQSPMLPALLGGSGPSGSAGATSHTCGAVTSTTGGPCRRLVIGPGYCWQHR